MPDQRYNVKVSEAAVSYITQQAKLRNVMPGALITMLLEVVAEHNMVLNILDDGAKPVAKVKPYARGYSSKQWKRGAS